MIDIPFLSTVRMRSLEVQIRTTFLTAFLLLTSFLASSQPADYPIVSIMEPRGWIISTASGAYQLIVNKDGKIKPVYYGDRSEAAFGKKGALWMEDIDEIPVRGGVPNKTPVVELVYKDKVRDADLKFVQGEIIQIDGRPTLKIVQKDQFYNFTVISYIRALAEYDVIEKWIEVQNTDKAGITKLENLLSGSVVLPKGDYVLSHMEGKWGNEFQPANTKLTTGVKSLFSNDFKSIYTPSWYSVSPEGNSGRNYGPAWFGTVQYSGNWRIDFGRSFDGNVQIAAGINFWDTEWNLRPGEKFTTPKFISGYCNEGSEGGTKRLQKYIQQEILPKEHRFALRPVLYNSWYATTFNVNEEQQLALAKTAKEIGVETFVIDDGWFKGRINDKGGLGDWEPDKTKFPNGLQPMISKINAMGLDFGIWIEPEMVNPNSDLYRKHPEWVFNFPNRTLTQHRNQLVLNLAREDVYQYLYKSFHKLLSENNIKYIKWDHNRGLTEPGWPDAPAGQEREARIRYINNLYKLISSLRKDFPEVWFENCSSGGGRADIGMMSITDMTWISDNTDPLDRLMIQYGYLTEFPANTMISWVTQENFHQPMPLTYKFDVSMAGVLGVGYDITKWNEVEKTVAKDKIALYKRIRPLVQNGTVHRLVSPFESNRCALIYTNKDLGSAVLLAYNLAEYLSDRNPENNILKLSGLDESKLYSIEVTGTDPKNQDKNQYRGDYLMNVGIPWPVKGSNKSQIIILTSN